MASPYRGQVTQFAQTGSRKAPGTFIGFARLNPISDNSLRRKIASRREAERYFRAQSDALLFFPRCAQRREDSSSPLHLKLKK